MVWPLTVLSPPRNHLVCGDVAAFGGLPLLDEHDLGVVVAVLRVDSSVSSERRDDPERQAETGSLESVADAGCRVSEPLPRGVNRGMERDDMVRPTASLIIGDEECGLGVLGRCNHGFGDLALQPGAVVGGVRGVFGQLGRSDDDGDLGQSSIGRLCVESVE